MYSDEICYIYVYKCLLCIKFYTWINRKIHEIMIQVDEYIITRPVDFYSNHRTRPLYNYVPRSSVTFSDL